MTREPENDAEPDKAELLHMYLKMLRIRLSPEEFRALGVLIKGIFDFMAADRRPGGSELPDEDELLATDEVRAELVTIIGILTTGTLDQQLIDFGDGIRVLVDSDAAADPARLEGIHDALRRDREVRRQEDDVLRGIAEASGLTG